MVWGHRGTKASGKMEPAASLSTSAGTDGLTGWTSAVSVASQRTMPAVIRIVPGQVTLCSSLSSPLRG